MVELLLRLLHGGVADHPRVLASHVGNHHLLLLLRGKIGCGRFHHPIIVLEHHLRIPHEGILRDPPTRVPVRSLLRETRVALSPVLAGRPRDIPKVLFLHVILVHPRVVDHVSQGAIILDLGLLLPLELHAGLLVFELRADLLDVLLVVLLDVATLPHPRVLLAVLLRRRRVRVPIRSHLDPGHHLLEGTGRVPLV